LINGHSASLWYAEPNAISNAVGLREEISAPVHAHVRAESVSDKFGHRKCVIPRNKYNFATRAAVLALTSSAAFAFNTSVRAQPPPGPLWYNGDTDLLNGLSNERDTELGSGQFSSVYDNFNVTGGGWNVTEVFSRNLVYFGFVVRGATWEIRSGTTLVHTGGTLVASGTTVAPIVTVIHCGNVTPISNLTGRSFDEETMGANCVGTPCGNDGNSFLNSNFFDIKWKPTASLLRDRDPKSDFSMGVNGTALPATLVEVRPRRAVAR
jgi:hypothetical protein